MPDHSSVTLNSRETEFLSAKRSTGRFLARVRAMFFLRVHYYPTGHTKEYTRKQLSGLRAMPLETMQFFLLQVHRYFGIGAAVAALREMFGHLPIAIVPASRRERKPLNQERLEADVAVARLQIAIADAGAEICAREQRRIDEAVVTAQLEIGDLSGCDREVVP